MEDNEKRLMRVEMKVETIEKDLHEMDNDIKGLNQLCKQLADLTNELRINTQTNKEILESIRSENPAKRIGKLEIEFNQMKQDIKEDKEQRKKYTYWLITAIGGTIITAIMALLL